MLYPLKFATMLAQMDLFSSLSGPETVQENTPALKPHKLSPPAIIHVEMPELIVQDVPKLEKAPSDDTHSIKSNRGRKSIKDMSLEAARIDVPADDILFSKLYYGIGEVASMFQVNASLLRYWESEFDVLKPRKNKKGDRFFRPEDIKNLQLIHHLLRERKYTIEGAKDFLKKSKKSTQQFEIIENLKKIKSFLLEMKAGL